MLILSLDTHLSFESQKKFVMRRLFLESRDGWSASISDSKANGRPIVAAFQETRLGAN